MSSRSGPGTGWSPVRAGSDGAEDRVCGAAHGCGGAWRRSGAMCSASGVWASRTISSTWADTRCWQRRSSPASESFGYELPLRRLFEMSTVEGLARDLEELGETAGHPQASSLFPLSPRTQELPLSFAQERLWFLERSSRVAPCTTSPRRQGSRDPSARRARRRPGGDRPPARGVRTIFAEADSRPVQRIAPWTPFELPVVDLRAYPSLPAIRLWSGCCGRRPAGPLT